MGIKQMTFLDYDGFLEKFETKTTTDDCYTPENVYAAVLDWCMKEYNLAGREIVRPFWPGGDYEAYDYPPDCVVIDNPPFSIVSKIAKWYAATGVSFFLFSPYLTNFSIGAGDRRISHIITPCSVLYENGATIDTCFVTNLDPHFIRSAPDLMDAIKAADKENRTKDKRELPKYEYPDAVITSTRIGYLCRHHTPLTISADDCAFIRKMDAQGDNAIFGGGYLLSERAAAERAAAERAAAERAAAERTAAERTATFRWQLSPREIEIQKLLGRKAERSTAK